MNLVFFSKKKESGQKMIETKVVRKNDKRRHAEAKC